MDERERKERQAGKGREGFGACVRAGMRERGEVWEEATFLDSFTASHFTGHRTSSLSSQAD